MFSTSNKRYDIQSIDLQLRQSFVISAIQNEMRPSVSPQRKAVLFDAVFGYQMYNHSISSVDITFGSRGEDILHKCNGFFLC